MPYFSSSRNCFRPDTLMSCSNPWIRIEFGPEIWWVIPCCKNITVLCSDSNFILPTFRPLFFAALREARFHLYWVRTPSLKDDFRYFSSETISFPSLSLCITDLKSLSFKLDIFFVPSLSMDVIIFLIHLASTQIIFRWRKQPVLRLRFSLRTPSSKFRGTWLCLLILVCRFDSAIFWFLISLELAIRLILILSEDEFLIFNFSFYLSKKFEEKFKFSSKYYKWNILCDK